MTQQIDIDPQQIIARYRGELENARHNNLLLEIAVQELQSRVNQLEEANKQLTSKLESTAEKSEHSVE